jgi:DNA repair protein RadC
VPSIQLAKIELHYVHDAKYSFPNGKRAVSQALHDWGLSTSPQEVGWVVAFDGDANVYTIVEVARGSTRRLPIHMPSLLSAVLVSGADRFMFIHNHPGANIEPSQEDLLLTQQIAVAAASVGLYFEDHLIVTSSGDFTSLRMRGLYAPPQHTETEAAKYGVG